MFTYPIENEPRDNTRRDPQCLVDGEHKERVAVDLEGGVEVLDLVRHQKGCGEEEGEHQANRLPYGVTTNRVFQEDQRCLQNREEWLRIQ